MTSALSLPQDQQSIQVVGSLTELFNTKIKGPINCLLLRRQLDGDFDGLAVTLSHILGIGSGGLNFLDYDRLMNISSQVTCPRQLEALNVICHDIKEIQSLNTGGSPILMLKTPFFNQGEKEELFHTDGQSHNLYAEHTLCCYNKPTTEHIFNHHARVSSESVDLYEAERGAPVMAFEAGSLYRFLGRYFGVTLPFIHRPPLADGPRLLLSVLKINRLG